MQRIDVVHHDEWSRRRDPSADYIIVDMSTPHPLQYHQQQKATPTCSSDDTCRFPPPVYLLRSRSRTYYTQIVITFNLPYLHSLSSTDMASSHASLDAAATERKARLAKLKSLKRKHPDGEEDTQQTNGEAKSVSPDVTTTYLSGRNYDPTTRGPKLGFESAPIEDQETLEDRVQEIVDATAKQAEEDEKADKPIDLFKLQPKKPNWDLKRDLHRKLDVLNVRTENAIARLVRERIEAARKAPREKGKTSEEGTADADNVGMEGTTLVEGIHVREREEEEDERRERDDEEVS